MGVHMREVIEFEENPEFDKRYDTIQAKVAAATPGERLVTYCVFKKTKGGLPIDNLDKIAVRGKVVFVAKNDPFWGEGTNYESDVVSSPTWLDVAVLANYMIATTGDRQHSFLEGIEIVLRRGPVKYLNFIMGS